MGSKIMISAMVALILAGCAANKPPPAPKIEIQPVLVPVKCIKSEEVPNPPKYLTGEGPYLGGAEAANMLIEDFESAKAYGLAMDRLVVGCISGVASAAK